MPINLSFLGATQNVTGSRYLIETDNLRLLVDCGLYQEREFAIRNWGPFPIPPNKIDAILLTHAHLDHCGWLPKLVHDGFQGKIYSTAATSDIAEIMLLDSAKLQQEDSEFKRKRHRREDRKGPFQEIPLYTVGDVEASLPLFTLVKYKEPVQIGDGVKATFYDAGHVLGSSMIEVAINQDNEERKILFSGDVGRWDKPILRNPTLCREADYILVESTYGDRLHEGAADIYNNLAEVINSTMQAGGNIVVPSFALERSQEILYYLNELLIKDLIPHMMVFLDSPMAVNITKIFKRHPELFDQEMTDRVNRNKSPFNFPGLNMTQTVDESKAINHIRGTIMIIAGSGMCTGGRIKHHLEANISKLENTILFVGYQARGTLGRHIINGSKEIRILGQQHAVKARIAQIHGLSSHADRDELLRWLSELKKAPTHIFITHGEQESAEVFSSFLKEKTGWGVSIPGYGEKITL
ncbi:MBL fold metallo-hydrolase RNA specificity domain-containing protein [Chloroflexota bacterium]